MILLPPVKGSGSVKESLSVLFVMLKKFGFGLRRRQKLPILNWMERGVGVVLSSSGNFSWSTVVRTSGVLSEDG